MRLPIAVYLELVKVFRQRGTYVSYGVLAAVTGLTVWGIHQSRVLQQARLARTGGTEMAIGGNIVTAYTVAQGIMEPVFIVLAPMLVAMIGGGLIASEHRSGVLRAWLCRPVSRLTLYTAKGLAGGIYAVTLSLFLGLFALLLGYIVFGGGDLMTLGGGRMVILEESLALPRLALAYGLAALMMCCIASLALLGSTIFENPLVASGSAVAIIPISAILQHMDYFAGLKPYLLTTYLDVWTDAFKATLEFSDFHSALYCVAGYCLIPYAIGAVIFWRRDVTS